MRNVFRMWDKTEVIECGRPDIHGSNWCREGVIFKVVNGSGRLKEICSKEDEDYYYLSQLRLNEFPIIQGRFPICPTCYGMLATGYGIENIKCDELALIRKNLNQSYTDIKTVFLSLMPLLKLLADGYYMLADVELAPTDGHNFFYNVPNEMTENTAVCDEYYNHDFFTVTDGFPAFMYPTQSSKLIDDKCVEEYKLKIEQGSEIRGLAYYEKGFVCALLDGHHKAVASALLGKKLKCLTIIPSTGCIFGKSNLPLETKIVKSISFAGISMETEQKTTYKEVFSDRKKQNVRIEKYELTDNRFFAMNPSVLQKYHSIDQISCLDAAGILDAEITEKDIELWISCPDHYSMIKLLYLMEYRAISDYESAYHIAEQVISSNHPDMPYKEAWKILVGKKDSHTEDLAMQYLIDHNSKDYCWDVVSSFWE